MIRRRPVRPGPRPVPYREPTPEERAGMDELVLSIPLALASRYLRRGWAVRPMTGHHAGKALASRWVPRGGGVEAEDDDGAPV